MPKLGLALSGGGFRATLYHLGVVRLLRDAGRLQDVTDIASVSGGSILAAHLVLNWDRFNGDDQQFQEATDELIEFVQFDVRNHIIRRLPWLYPLKTAGKLVRVEGSRFTPNAILEHYYRTLLYGDRRLYELPAEPALHILTTNISNGALSVFNRQGLHIQQRDGSNTQFEFVSGQMASIPRVVGASSAFPGLFPPVQITAEDIGVREGQFATEWFTDGGVYDNLGIRAFSWLQQQDTDFDQVLVSDAGKPFQVLNDAALGFIGQSVRATDILWDRVWQLERENFGKRNGFVFMPITELVDQSEDPTALHPVVQAEIQSIRTDLDCFSDLEINALSQHGYEVARKICRESGIELGEAASTEPWRPIVADPPAEPATTETAHVVAEPTQQSIALRRSSRRRTWSTLLSLKDWTSYVYIALALVLFIYCPLQIYKLYRHSQTQAIVIEAISQGDPDIRQILDLIESDPTVGWQPETIEEQAEPTPVSTDNIEVLVHSRIIDLRRWSPATDKAARKGRIYVRDRRTVKLIDPTNRKVVFSSAFELDDVECQQPNSMIKGKIRRITQQETNQAAPDDRKRYELEYDFGRVPLGEAVTLEMESLATYPGLLRARAPFETLVKTDLLTVWMFFPEDRPYRAFDLVRFPADRSEPPEVMDVRYSIAHPYGSLIGWSVVNPQVGMVYECRWLE